jgi:hypothetical protein
MTGIELVNYHAQIMSELPVLLSQLVESGKTDDAVRLLTTWGNHTKANSEIWKEAKELLSA